MIPAENILAPTKGPAQDSAPAFDFSKNKEEIPNAIPKELAEERAFKYALALNEDYPSVLNTLQGLNGDRMLRQQAVQQDMESRREHAIAILKDPENSFTAPVIDGIVAASNTPIDENTSLERKYAEGLMSHNLAMSKDPRRIQDVLNDMPNSSAAMQEVFIEQITKREVFSKLKEEADQAVKNSTWGGWLKDFGKSMIPFYTWSTQINDTLGEKLSSYLPGKNKQEQYSLIYQKSPKEAEALARSIYTEMAASNKQEAAAWLDGLLSYTDTNASLESVFAGLDIASLTPVGLTKKLTSKAAVKGVEEAGVKAATIGVVKKELEAANKTAVKEFGKRAQRLSEAVSQRNIKAKEVLSATGHLEEASDAAALEFARRISPNTQSMEESIKTLVARTPSMFDANWFKVEASNYYKQRADRLSDILERNREAFTGAMTKAVNVARLPADLERYALERAKVLLDTEANQNGLQKAVLSVKSVKAEDTPLNITHLDIVLGRKNGTLFPNYTLAKTTAEKKYGFAENTFSISQEGDGFAIRYRKDINEKDPEVLNRLITPENTSSLERNKILGIIPSPKALHGAKENLSEFQNKQRATLTHATVAEENFYKDVLTSLSSLSKREQSELNHMMRLNRDTYRVPGDPETRGFFYQSALEFEEAFMKQFGKLPTESQTEAYATFLQLSDMDYISRSVSLMKAKALEGVEKISVALGKKDVAFEGIVKDKLPLETEHDLGIFLIRGNKTEYYRLKDPAFKPVYEAFMENNPGAKALHTYAPESREFRDALGTPHPVNFVLTDNFKKGPIVLAEQLPYKQGFHVKYKEPKYIKQPTFTRDALGRKIYTGDITILGSSNEAKALKEAALFEDAAAAFRNKDTAALQKVLDRGLPFSLDEIATLFKEKIDPTTPFYLTDNGRNAAHPTSRTVTNGRLLDDGSVVDLSNNPYNLERKFTSEYLGHKDGPLWSIKDGTEENPIASLAEARTFDPIETQLESMGRLIRDKHYTDYQMSAASSFVEEFGDMIRIGGKAVSKDSLRQNPAYYLTQGTLEGAAVDKRYATAVNAKTAITNLLKHRSLLGDSYTYLHNKLISKVYERWGERAATVIDDLTPIFEKDPIGKMRALAFHSKLGLFNFTQVFVQSQTAFAALARSPKHGLNGALASAWTLRMSLTPGDETLLKNMAKRMSRITPGWTEDMFVEAYKSMKDVGFDLVGGDVTFRNDIASPKLVTNGLHKFLDWGASPFTYTERQVRYVAWNTAYSEYVGKGFGAVGKLSRDDIQNILTRAQSLSGNMTRDAHAFWNEKEWSLLTQFWSYQMRMFDMLTGKSISTAEKSRLIAFNCVMYGIPIGVSPLLPFWPWQDYIKQHLMEKGVDTDSDLVGLFLNGAVATAVAGLTDTKPLNVGERWGPQSLSILTNLTKDKAGETPLDGLLATIGGASENVLLSVLSDTAPVIKDVASWMKGDTSLELVAGDVNALFKNVSAYNNIERAVIAYNTGVYKTKSGRVLFDDYQAWESYLHAITGLERQDASNSYLRFKTIQDKKNFENKIKSDAKPWMRLYLKAMDDGNYKLAEEYSAKIKIYFTAGNLTDADRIKTFQEVQKEESLFNTSVKQFDKAFDTNSNEE